MAFHQWKNSQFRKGKEKAAEKNGRTKSFIAKNGNGGLAYRPVVGVANEIREYDWEKLERLAENFRRHILEVTLKNGGHLASNLGVVELTIALHRVFDFPPDCLIFDVSHQCYTHKLLTGRGPLFNRLRQWGGISGFSDRAEHPTDLFTSGHGGTALSSALGLAVGRDRRGGKHHVVAVIGDASLSCGLSAEALQHIVDQTSRLIIILNDNGRSIDDSVGSWAAHLRKLSMGKSSPNLFTDGYGLDYLGPIDGHNFSQLESALREAKQGQRPLMIHVKTCKGKGYSLAAESPSHFHGLSPAQIFPDEPAPTTFSEILGETLCEFAAEDPRIIAITAAMAHGTGLKKFSQQFPSRFFDVGIAESHALTFAGGLAASHLRPLCAIYSSFSQRAVDNFFHDVCLQNLPVVLCMDRSGLSNGDGDTHHGLFDIALLGGFPHLIFAQPSSLQEFRNLLWTAFSTNGPFLIRYEKGAIGGPITPVQPVEIGRSRICDPGIKSQSGTLDGGDWSRHWKSENGWKSEKFPLK
jgi:1-deoxy-D-xylulose-5-phosphate synthase